jgi:LmbE family N-acetylglucosaminyl deacetylase
MSSDRCLFLSPHLDDAVLSCGGLISRLTRVGHQVVILTVFAGSSPVPEFSAAARQLHGLCGYPDELAVDVRRREDRAALEHLGAKGEHLDFPECLYRCDSHGLPLYPTLDSIFPETPSEPRLLEELSRSLARRVGELGPGRVFLPLAIGRHVDHTLVRNAVDEERVRHAGALAHIVYWEDFPYAARGRVPPPTTGLRQIVVPTAPTEWRLKLNAVRMYESQVRLIWRSAADMERELRRYSTGIDGVKPVERYWTSVRGPLSGAHFSRAQHAAHR